MALRLLRTGLRVLVLESGADAPDAATQELYAAEIANPALHAPGQNYRARRFGGSSTIWGGRCVPFDPFDFERRPWVTDALWPIEYDDVAKWYPSANALCEAGAFDYDARTAVPGMAPLIAGFAPQHFSCDGIERFSCPTNFAARYRHKLDASQNIDVLLHANVTEIITDGAGSIVTRLAVRTLAGVSFDVAPLQTVLAAGGLEVVRLLLASRRTHVYGIGNAHDQVGRNYMCHIAGVIGRLQLHAPEQQIAHGYAVAPDGTYCRRRMALKFSAQKAAATASAVLRLHFPNIRDPAHRSGPLSALYLAKPFISYEYAKRLTGDGTGGASLWLRHAANVAWDPFGTARFLLHWGRHRSLAARKFPSVIVRSRARQFSLDYHAEQAPNRDSRVSLADETRGTDALGMPKLWIDWRYSPLDVHTAQETLRLLREDFRSGGHGSLDYDPAEVEYAITRDGAYGGHHIGTARMGTSATSSVVDRNCQIHGVRNLYVAGSAVFPTSSQANPTLTIVALALRLADHVRAAA
jgi:choline dehydrogenase-like flavoprotein